MLSKQLSLIKKRGNLNGIWLLKSIPTSFLAKYICNVRILNIIAITCRSEQ